MIHIASSPRRSSRDVFSQETVAQLAAAPHGPFDQGAAADASRGALAILEQEVRACLSQPLVLVYTSLTARGMDGKRWLLPLPSGAIAVVYVGAAEKTLRTCYFTGAASVNLPGRPSAELKARRWRIALRELVKEHAVFDGNCYRLPGRQHRREKSIVGGQPEMCIDMRFIAPRMWGFSDDAAGSEWTAPTWTWPSPAGGQTVRLDQ